jgi:hypothetical protein
MVLRGYVKVCVQRMRTGIRIKKFVEEHPISNKNRSDPHSETAKKYN